ncbi:CDP-diacylglycerol--serine O-phosphatidyltransferase [Marinicella sp. S1101]|uniref:CDP-diacylglycerol--serine O-phosphatidyltransferase n=1 Tax=Marinicella marina TaxID=2996016 RepID=UPI00226086F6|nr:CDP-diacylglycerol--serine O-phosphatidyltransferase [Marinicella marina]MCX7552668.1 CDP-diacylglycerol--serine O-phosphatidyltransferase [Marinicella marina]MDJ1139544.1 CDP-diacylglycerol--serine O-phosphatidyltransferase [Marinicella marina]
MSKTTPPQRKGIYLLPNLFTTGALFAGYYSIIAGIQGKYEMASVCIFIAALLDALDGRVARLTNTQSEFGEQYDSLSDLVSFGVAPSLLMFNWSLYYLSEVNPVLGKLGWLAAFIYAVSGALRLARFNTQIGVADKAYFQGLPSPAAAAVLSAFVWVCVELELSGVDLKYIALPMTIITGLLMVSRFRYYSFKTIPFKENVSFVWILILVLIFVLLTIKTAWVLFVVFSGYALSGIVFTVMSIKRKRAGKKTKDSKPPKPTADNDES